MKELNPSEIKKKIVELGNEQSWNHNIELSVGIETLPKNQSSHGKNLIKWGRIEPILDLMGISGKRVLDIGCNEGFFSLKLANKGAYVLGGDIDELRIKKAQFVQSIFNKPNLEFKVLDVLSPEFHKLRPFDYCICMGFLHRIPDPYRAIDAISHKTDMILFEWKALKHGLHDESYAYFSQKSIDNNDYYGTEYWLLSYSVVESILKRLGFKYFYRVDDPRQRRGILVAGKHSHEIFVKPNIILHRGRLPAFMSHTKRYLKTIIGILDGRLNS